MKRWKKPKRMIAIHEIKTPMLYWIDGIRRSTIMQSALREGAAGVKDLFFVFIGGGLGSACRWLVSTSINRYLGNSLAWGTATVNLAGCLLIGFLVGLVDRELLPKEVRILLVTGFLGGFTTFSSFALESVGMFRERAVGAGLLNIAINVVAGFALTMFGVLISRRVP